MPTSQAELEGPSQLVKQCHPLLDGVFGLIDGLSLCTQVSDNLEIENATYNGWKSSHCINNVFVFLPEGKCTVNSFVQLTSAPCRCHPHCGDQHPRKLAWCTCCMAHFRQTMDEDTRRLLPCCWYSIPMWCTFNWRENSHTTQKWWTSACGSRSVSTHSCCQLTVAVLPPDSGVGDAYASRLIWKTSCPPSNHFRNSLSSPHWIVCTSQQCPCTQCWNQRDLLCVHANMEGFWVVMEKFGSKPRCEPELIWTKCPWTPI